MSEPIYLPQPESARTLLARCGHGVLSTTLEAEQPTPYGSLIQYAVSPEGQPIFLISDLAEHTRNLKQDPRASLLVTDALGLPTQDALAHERATLVGRVAPSDQDQRQIDRQLMLERHPATARYIDFGDFALYRLQVEKVRYVAGFGRMSWIRASTWEQAQPDPTWPQAAGILQHMNEDHADALLLYAQVQGQTPQATAAQMTGVDRLGFEIMVTAPEQPQRKLRLNFPESAPGSGAIRRALVAMVKQARQAQAPG